MLYKEACGFLRGVGTQNGAVLSFSILVYFAQILICKNYAQGNVFCILRKMMGNLFSNVSFIFAPKMHRECVFVSFCSFRKKLNIGDTSEVSVE